jgi:GT2 family glycosyltransferase
LHGLTTTVSEQPADGREEGQAVPCTAVIVTYQSAVSIGALLESLEAERRVGLDLEALVVDNSSTDNTGEIVTRFDWVTFVPSGGNLGYAAGINVGSQLVPRERALLVLNPDLLIFPGAVAQMLDGLNKPGIGVVVPRILNAHGKLDTSLRNEPSVVRKFVDAILGSRAVWLPAGWSEVIWDLRIYDREQFPDWAAGAALLVSSDCRTAVGDWDESYFLYSEEVDYLRRVREAGLSVRYEPTAVVQHVSGGSGRSDGLYALLVVNSVRYYRQHHSRAPSMLFAVATALRQILRGWRPACRLALRALLSRSTRSTLPQPTQAT